MSRCFLVLILLLVAGCGQFAGDESDSEEPSGDLRDQVTVAQGRLQGVEHHTYEVLQFLGVPYGEPPLEAFRWREPQPLEPWVEIRPATQVAQPCIQGVSRPSSGAVGREDCLYLNITAPQAAADRPRPVMVWFHGIDNDSGSGSWEPTDPDAMAALADTFDAVVVSVNARLGLLGYLALPELVVESPFNSTGNYHHLDQVAALTWLRDNIAVFNGNPLNITLVGQGAGANDVCLHLSSPLSVNLFQAAILHSSNCLSAALEPVADRLLQGADYVGYWGCSAALDVLACLRAQDASMLVNALFDAGKPTDAYAATAASAALFSESAAIDQYAFTGPVETTLGVLVPNTVPVLLGVNRNEYTLSRQHSDLEQPTTLGEYSLAIQAHLPQYASEPDLLKLTGVLYPVNNYDSYSDAFADLMGDALYACPSIEMANILSNSGRFVYFYHFVRAINNSVLLAREIVGEPGEDAPAMGVAHSADIGYLWNDRVLLTGDDPQATVRAVQDYWSSFVRSGEPSADDESAWPAYNAIGGRYLEIGEDIAEALRFKSTQCLFFNGT